VRCVSLCASIADRMKKQTIKSDELLRPKNTPDRMLIMLTGLSIESRSTCIAAAAAAEQAATKRRTLIRWSCLTDSGFRQMMPTDIADSYSSVIDYSPAESEQHATILVHSSPHYSCSSSNVMARGNQSRYVDKVHDARL